jgi:uncharacterized sulfatase
MRLPTIIRFTALLLASPGTLHLAAALEDSPPNLHFIISDDHGWSDYGFMGHPHLQTPQLDRLAAQSLTFHRGYLALQTGKWWEGAPVETAGFTHAMTRGEAPSGRHGDAGLDIGRKGLEPIYRFIEQAGQQPWMVWYAPMLPHAPHTPPEDLLQKYLKLAPTEPVARYWACVEWFDRTCGELLDHLDQIGQRDNTIVLYTTDNGWIQNPDTENRFAPRSKLTPYEGGVRTPIMLSWPGTLKPRVDGKHLASNVDLWPTLAALLKCPTPQGLPGINLTDARAVARRQRIYGEQYAHNITDVDAPTQSLEHCWIIDGWWKLIVPDPRHHPAGRPELYDLRNDPCEKTDLTSTHTRRVRSLRQRLDVWWTPPSGPLSAFDSRP